MRTRVLVLGAAVGLLLSPAVAAPPPAGEAIQITDIMGLVSGVKSALPVGGGPELPPFEEVTKDMKAAEGLFTLWSYPPGTKDKDAEKLLCQIPSSFLGEKFMLSTSFAGGGFLTGFPLDEKVVQWELLDKQLVLVEPETRYVQDDKQTVSDVVRRTYPERIRAAVPLVTKSPKGDPVIDFGALLKSNFADIAWMSAGFGPMMIGGGSIDTGLSKWTTKKSFELNVEIGVALALSRTSPPGSYDKKSVHYSFWKLPKTDYAPRVADDRVGYFLTANQDWGKPTSSRDLFNRYVDRWHLVKRDPTLALSEPVQPITFYIEKTVPVRFRKAVRDGILEWNKAYEKVGFSNAVEVRQQTDDNDWRDLDPEDMRYSFFRWIVTGAGFAMGPHRANPFTGQIYDADIIFDDSMVRFYEQSAGDLLPSALVSMKLDDMPLQDFLAKHPQWQRPTKGWEGFTVGGDADEQVRKEALRRIRERGDQCCTYASGMKHQLALAESVLAGQPPEVIDKLLYDVVKEVVMHEVGHTLGLRHNFKASTVWDVDEIRKRRVSGEATTGSVMDYNPVLFFGDKALDGFFVTPTIGPYDYWAIEYGYRPADGSKIACSATTPDGKDEPPKKEDKDKETVKGAVTIGGGAVKLDGIPEAVLKELPPEIKKMIESGAAAALLGGGEAPKARASSGPSFKGAPSGEADMLQKIAGRAAEPELTYGSDEDTTGLGPDPKANRFDMGRDPIEWARTRVELINQRMAKLLEWGVKDGESWYYLRRAFQHLLMEKAFVFDYVGSYIGGQHVTRSHRGDANAKPPFELVSPEKQREALKFITDNVFSDSFFNISPDVLNHLAAARWWHEGANVNFVVDYPIHDIIGVLQWWNLFDRLFPNTIRRVHDAELKTASNDKLTAAEYVQAIQKACWGDSVDATRAKGGTWSDTAPYVSDVRRSLQREYLSLVEPLVRVPPGTVLSPDLHALVQHALRTLNGRIKDTLATGKLDFASEAHLVSCQSRIERMLTPELDEFRSAMR